MLNTIELPPRNSKGGDLHLCYSAQYIEKPASRSTWWSTAWWADNDDDVLDGGRLIGGAADGGRGRNLAREAKRQRDYLKDYFNNEGAVAWQDGRI